MCKAGRGWLLGDVVEGESVVRAADEPDDPKLLSCHRPPPRNVRGGQLMKLKSDDPRNVFILFSIGLLRVGREMWVWEPTCNGSKAANEHHHQRCIQNRSNYIQGQLCYQKNRVISMAGGALLPSRVVWLVWLP